MLKPILQRKSLALSLLLLTACETSTVWYLSHPERKELEIDGYTLHVVPRGKNLWDVVTTSVVMEVGLKFKQAQVKAVEQVTGCKVIDSDYLMGSGILQAEVSCPQPASISPTLRQQTESQQR